MDTSQPDLVVDDCLSPIWKNRVGQPLSQTFEVVQIGPDFTPDISGQIWTDCLPPAKYW